ncbi:unnamed protein product [Heterobilharzia americana]|nr:unnamed protein product [Heterobilharzia americana]
MENNLTQRINSSDDVWQPRCKYPVTSSSTAVVNHDTNLQNASNGSLLRGISLETVGETNVLTNHEEAAENLEKTKTMRIGLRSFLRKAASLKDSCSSPTVECSVVCLDGKCFRFNVHKVAYGRELWELVCQCLDIEDSQYFGLVYYLNPTANRNSVVGTYRADEFSSNIHQDGSDKLFHLSSSSIDEPYPVRFCGCSTTNSFNPCKVYSYDTTYRGFNPFFIDVPFWLDVEKRITDQCHGSKLTFYFQVKFYPQHPDLILECPKSRRQFCLQLRQHLCIGRLLCSFETHVILGALIAQMDLGDAAKYRRPRSSHLSYRSTECAESTSHSFSQQRSVSLTHSFSSERRCSLAEPEHSDDSIIWDTRTGDKKNEGKNYPSPDVNKRYILGHIGCNCSTSQTDSISMIYLQCLPHLARGSVASSSMRRSSNNIMDGSRPSLSSSTMNNDIDDTLLSPLKHNLSPGWPYPKSDCRYCPVLLSRITRLHRNFRGMLQEDAEKLFLKNVKKLAFYGVELHPIKKFHASYISSSYFKSMTKKLVRSFSDRSGTTRTESYHNFTDDYSMNGSIQTLNSSRLRKSLLRSSLKSSIRRIFTIQPEGPALFPFAFTDFPNFDFSLGVYYAGLFLQWGHLRLSHYAWSQIMKICFHLDEFCAVVKDDKVKSSSCPQIMLKFKFACRKLAKRFYRTCVEHHIFFKLHQRHFLNSNANRLRPCKPQTLILHLRQKLQINDEINPSVSINGPCSIEQLSVCNLQSPRLPATPTRSESEIGDPLPSSNKETNHEFPEFSTQSVYLSLVDSKCQTSLYPLKKIYSNAHLVPSTSSTSTTRNASCLHLDTHSVVHVASPVECSSRLNILNATDKNDDCKYATVQLCDVVQIPDDSTSDPVCCVHQATSNSADVHFSFNSDDDVVTDTLSMSPENPGCERSSDRVDQSILDCRNHVSSDSVSINCALTNIPEVKPVKPTGAPWCNVFSFIDISSLDKIIAPSYSSLISSDGQIIRLTPASNDTVCVNSSISSQLPCDFVQLNSNEKQIQYLPIPIVRTRAVRFIYDASLQINEYKTFSNHSQIHLVCGVNIPLVPTKSFYHY